MPKSEHSSSTTSSPLLVLVGCSHSGYLWLKEPMLLKRFPASHDPSSFILRPLPWGRGTWLSCLAAKVSNCCDESPDINYWLRVLINNAWLLTRMPGLNVF